MAESVNRVTESAETAKGLLSSIDHQQLPDQHNGRAEDADDRNIDPNDLSRYERLCRFFFRRRGRTDSTDREAIQAAKASEARVEEEPGETVVTQQTSAITAKPGDDVGTQAATVFETATPEQVTEPVAPVPSAEKILPAQPAVTAAETPPVIEQPPIDDSTALGSVPTNERQSAVEATATPVVKTTPPSEEEAKAQRFGRIKTALSKTSQGLGRVFLGKKQIDDDLLEDLETQLLTADLGFEVTTQVIDALTEGAKRNELKDVDAMQAALKALLVEILQPCETPLDIETNTPFVLMTVGVNGVGKTTTIGKLARLYLSRGKSVMLAAGDTFRAAAVEQLQVWGERNGVPVVAQHTGADSASVIYDAVESAKARDVDLLIADTAGRLHTKSNLMDELTKIRRVVGKLDESAPHEVLLVLDAGTGQNAVTQLKQFHEAVGVTGIVLTKLDGTAKGGVVFALCSKFGIPVRFIGVGEGAEDLQPFNASEFVDALLASN